MSRKIESLITDDMIDELRDRLKRSRRVRRRYVAPTDEMVHRMIASVWSSKRYLDNPKGMFLRWRDSTLLKLLFFCGLRPAEACNLKWEDIDFNTRFIKMNPWFNKQREGRPAKLSMPAQKALMEFHAACDELGFSFTSIFPSTSNFMPLSSDHVNTTVRSIAREAGVLEIAHNLEGGRVRYNISPYSGRRYFGKTIWQRTHSETAVQFALRQSNRASTEPYVQPTQEDLTRIVDGVFQ